VATERPTRDVVLGAVAEARRIPGSITLAPADALRWVVVRAAVDGALELTVAEPPARGLMDGTRWLHEHGFASAEERWVLPLAASTPGEQAAAHVEEAFAGALGVDLDAPLARGDVNPGVLDHDVPAATAPRPRRCSFIC